MNDTLRAKTSAKTYKTAELKIQKIINKIDSLKLSNAYISRLELQNKIKSTIDYKSCAYFVISVLILFGVSYSGRWIYDLVDKRNCVLASPSFYKSAFRPPEDCSMCTEVNDVVRLVNTSAEEFDKYAYSTTPVIVTDGTQGWKAIQEFNFQFFANFYKGGGLGKQINSCSFFAYKSGLNSLQEVFNMDEARANLSGSPWYVGWSTCYDEETRRLRSYYNRPYFLPKNAESHMVDWIFMGGPGQGAQMHLDSVTHMSWQAQVRGHKQWELAPPPECLYRCKLITFTVSPGEILVVNTNRWFHKTRVLPGDISITIGAEYD